MAAPKLKPSIILIGGTRAGTGIVQQLIGLHPKIVIWYEPRTLWRYPSAKSRPDDLADTLFFLDANELGSALSAWGSRNERPID
jgi:hypothetical protein